MQVNTSKFNESASVAYRKLTDAEKESYASIPRCTERQLTDRGIIKEGKKIFERVQKLVCVLMHMVTLIVYTHYVHAYAHFLIV